VKNLSIFKKKRLLVILLITSSLSYFGLFIDTEYYYMSPGPPYEWDITIEAAQEYESEGNLYQLTVRRDIANYALYTWAYFSDSVDLYPKEVILPKGVTPSELSQISLQNMQTSENVAIAVALNSLGYNVQSEGDGVLVVGILDNSPVKGKLLKNDLIISVSGEKEIIYSVNSSTQFISLLRTFSIGETVIIGILRNDKKIQIETELIEHIEYKNEPMVGFLASTPNQRFTFPINVDIDTGRVGGPSAGLMMALNVYNKLSETDITNSTVIAGTGTIEIDGSVGPVGGVKQKVIAAKRAGATLILVPTANYEDAKSYKDDETSIVAVESFKNALQVIFEYSSR
jgi:PDZ domain-containing protein